MRPLTADELLRVWENTWNKSALEKSIHLIAATSSNSELKQIAQLSIGERDARLLLLRKWMFGNRLLNLTNCPECKEQVEWEMKVDDVSLQSPKTKIENEVLELQIEDFHLKFRLINSIDILRKNNHDSKSLLNHCILEVKKGEENFKKENLPEIIYETIEKQMSKVDPQAHVSLSLNCPSCEHTWSAPFSIMHYIWIEIEAWVKHMLQDVYLLAKNFNWSEKDILNMNPNRRQLYLQMLNKR